MIPVAASRTGMLVQAAQVSGWSLQACIPQIQQVVWLDAGWAIFATASTACLALAKRQGLATKE
jgi:hypothetical protein